MDHKRPAYLFIVRMMKDLKGKKLLVLGGKAATVNVVQLAKKMGIETYVTGIQEGGQAKEIADHTLLVGSEEHEKLIDYIRANHIDGVMTGSAEFQVREMIRLCAKAGLPCYATEAQWIATQDKRNFKDLCKRFGIPGVPEYSLTDVLNDEDFPVIVKPVDSCSSIGISICRNNEELAIAKEKALEASASKKILIERYIDNGGLTHVVKYVVVDGKFYMEIMGDRHVLNNGLITAITFFPSRNTELYMNTIDSKVKDAFLSIGFNNGVFFFQALPYGDNIYVYEMGLRTGGGMTYKITEATSGNNDLEMLINFALSGRMCGEQETLCIDPFLKGKQAASLAIPLRIGTIAKVMGMELIPQMEGVVNFTHFCDIGDSILPKHINTLSQLYGRIMVVRNSKKELFESLKTIRDTISVFDIDGNDMIIWDTFDMIYNDFCYKCDIQQ